MGHPPVCVAHHGDEQVEHKQCGDDGEGKVDDAEHVGQVHIVVGRPINDGEEKLKGAEQRHGIVIELPQVGWVLCLENDKERCSAHEEGMEIRKRGVITISMGLVSIHSTSSIYLHTFTHKHI